MAKRGAPKKHARVKKGRSVLTRIGTAHEGARVDKQMFSGGKKEFERLIKAGVLEYEKTLRGELEKASADAEQIAFDSDSGDSGSGDSDAGGSDSGDFDEKAAGKSQKKPSRQGAKRKGK